MEKESICRNCFHSYVCEQFNENKDDNNTKCHFANDHYVPTADVVPKSVCKECGEKTAKTIENLQKKLDNAKAEIARKIFAEIQEDCFDQFGYFDYDAFAELKNKYTEESQ